MRSRNELNKSYNIEKMLSDEQVNSIQTITRKRHYDLKVLTTYTLYNQTRPLSCRAEFI